MYCKNCGKEIIAGNTFCENCGEKVVTDQRNGESNFVTSFAKKIKTDTKTKALLIASACVLVLLIAIGIIISINANTLNLADYIDDVELSGIENYGTVTYEFDEDKLFEDVFGPAPADDTFSNLGKLIEYEEKCYELMECITINEIKDNGKLSNGDVAEIIISFESDKKDFGKRFKSGSIKQKIKGLKDGKIVDVFSEEYVNFEFIGVEGFGKIDCKQEYGDSWTRKVSYSFDRNNSLSNGDKVIVTAEIDEDSYDWCLKRTIENGEYLPRISTKELVVLGLQEGEYVDPFSTEFVSFNFTGVSGEGIVEAEKSFSERWVYGTTYSFDKETKLRNGDTITVTAEIDEDSYNAYLDELLEDGLVIKQKSTKQIKVSGLLGLLKADEITDEMIETAKQFVLNEYKESGDVNLTRKDVKIRCVYFRDKIDKSEALHDFWNGYDLYNSLDIVVSYTDMYGSTAMERTLSVMFINVTDEVSNILDCDVEDDGWATSILSDEEIEEQFYDELREEFIITKLQ